MSHLPCRLRWPPRYARSREGGTHKKTPPSGAAFKGKPGRRAAGAPAPVERLFLDEADLLHLRVLGLGQHLGEDAVLGLLVDVDLQCRLVVDVALRSEEHTSELQSLMRISYAVFCLKKKTQ